MQVPLIRLQCGANNYHWGKLGKSSSAARFAAATPVDGFEIQENQTYSELWMGTHPSNPSKDVTTQRTLLDLVQDNQAFLSPEISEKFGHKLPFLLKVLSIRQPLSIQAHPDKKLARQLHARDSKNYKDDNHKPEMAIALTQFDGLRGFRPLSEISHFLSHIPPLAKLIGEDAVKAFQSAIQGRETSPKQEDEINNKKALQKIFSTLMHSTKEDVQDLSKELVKSAETESASFAGGGSPSNTGAELAELVCRCNTEWPADIGLFVLFFLNYVKLQPGEAMFLKANDIHGYLSGDIIECMASSDNVVRSGFTPKFKDVTTLVDMLTYSYAPVEEQKMSPTEYPYMTLNTKAYSSGSEAMLYDPPIEEFSVVRTALRGHGAKATFEAIKGPSILICTQGEGTINVGPKTEAFKEGWVYFVGATAEVGLESQSDDFVTFKAFCEIEDVSSK